MNKDRKSNCWAFMRCGREPGGKHVATHGVCPAATSTDVDGINGGTNGGRCCWAIAGTLCFGKAAGTMAGKIQNCMDCAFYWTVADEEPDFTSSLSIPHKPGLKSPA